MRSLEKEARDKIKKQWIAYLNDIVSNSRDDDKFNMFVNAITTHDGSAHGIFPSGR